MSLIHVEVCPLKSGMSVLVQHSLPHVGRKGRVFGTTRFPTTTKSWTYRGATFSHQLKQVDFNLERERGCEMTIGG